MSNGQEREALKAAADAIRAAQDSFAEHPSVIAEILQTGDVADYLARKSINAYVAALATREESRWTRDLLDDWEEYMRCRDRGTHQRDGQERCVECGFDRDDFPGDEPGREDTERRDVEWHESRSGLLDRFCVLDTSDWDEGDFFHFLQKPWQSQYQMVVQDTKPEPER